MSANVQDLIPEMIDKVQRFLSLVPIPYVVTSTFRTESEQMALFSQGRATLPVVNLLRQKAGLKPIGNKDNTYTVTNCDGINTKSNHQSGRAIDVVPESNGGPSWPTAADPRWKQIAQAGKAVGLAWGGDWKIQDLPHYEMI